MNNGSTRVPYPLNQSPMRWIWTHLTDDKLILTREAILGDLEVQRGGAFACTAGDIIVRAVAGTEPAAEVTGFTDGDTTEVSADA